MNDYEQFLLECGLTEAQMQAGLAASVVDWTPQNGVLIAPSRINGKGVLAQRSFRPGDKIADVRRNGVWTLTGRYANHSASPNAQVRGDDGVFVLVATEHIAPGEEITADYRQVAMALCSATAI